MFIRDDIRVSMDATHPVKTYAYVPFAVSEDLI